MIVHSLSHALTRLIMCAAAHLQQYVAALRLFVSCKCNIPFPKFNSVSVFYTKINDILSGLRPGMFSLMPLHSLTSKSVKNEF